jgi:hypothetical protein
MYIFIIALVVHKLVVRHNPISMYKFIPTLSIIMFCLFIQPAKGQLIISGQDASNYSICDKWQSLNDIDKVLEFKKNGAYIAYNKGEAQIELQYEVKGRADGLIEIDILFGEGDVNPGKVTIQIVNPDRIRIYVWKHGDVLDLADEYYRTNDFDSMNKFLKEIIKQNK